MRYDNYCINVLRDLISECVHRTAINSKDLRDLYSFSEVKHQFIVIYNISIIIEK